MPPVGEGWGGGRPHTSLSHNQKSHLRHKPTSPAQNIGLSANPTYRLKSLRPIARSTNVGHKCPTYETGKNNRKPETPAVLPPPPVGEGWGGGRLHPSLFYSHRCGSTWRRSRWITRNPTYRLKSLRPIARSTNIGHKCPTYETGNHNRKPKNRRSAPSPCGGGLGWG